MQFERALKVRPGDQIACWNESRMELVTVEKVIEPQWRIVEFLVRNGEGKVYLVKMDHCNPG